jgi:hypothetical protein
MKICRKAEIPQLISKNETTRKRDLEDVIKCEEMQSKGSRLRQ